MQFKHMLRHYKCWRLYKRGMLAWRNDKTAKMLGINMYGCPLCGYGSVREKGSL